MIPDEPVLNDISEYMRAAVAKQARANLDAIETMCEMMLTQDPDVSSHGVLVKSNGDGTVTARLSPEVPFGTVGYLR